MTTNYLFFMSRNIIARKQIFHVFFELLVANVIMTKTEKKVASEAFKITLKIQEKILVYISVICRTG